ncbi:MAG: MFS transporter, partial [Candidatus Kerfeldbacteria bacterium]|nr:MFS transporter [Candidatus Kerfeldbacteria bacterium]
MNHRFIYALGGVLPHRLSPQMRELYWATLLQNLALAMLLLFEPIYLWQQGYGVRDIILFFLGVYLAYFLFMPLGAAYATRYGYEHSMAWSTVVQVIYYACFFSVAYSWWFLFPAAVLYAWQKALYWPAYHADFARYSDQTEEGREISGLSVALLLVYVVGPILAGILLTVGSWWLLFAVGSAAILLSNWPLLRTPEIFTPREFPYVDTYRRLIAPIERRNLLAYMGFGEELIVLVLWPVFISIVISGYIAIGAVVASTTLVTMLITLYAGKLADEHHKRAILKFSTILYAFGWLARLL